MRRPIPIPTARPVTAAINTFDFPDIYWTFISSFVINFIVRVNKSLTPDPDLIFSEPDQPEVAQEFCCHYLQEAVCGYRNDHCRNASNACGCDDHQEYFHRMQLSTLFP